MTELENKIREALPRLKKVEVGQKFLSKYYGIITATKVDNLGGGKYDIYGFDEMEGLPRSNYYPRDLELVGHSIKLNDVLEYLSLKNLNTKNYEVSFDINGAFLDINKYSDGDVKDYQDYQWDLSSVFLADQSEELKEFLNSL